MRRTPPTPKVSGWKKLGTSCAAGVKRPTTPPPLRAPTNRGPCARRQQSVDSTGNLLIKGDNLDVSVVCARALLCQVVFIHIDLPYNTKSDEFIHRDDFTARQTDILVPGYSADNVEYIQNILWRPHAQRLAVIHVPNACCWPKHSPLRDDGVIFISIDDNEQAQISAAMRVFGQENFFINGGPRR